MKILQLIDTLNPGGAERMAVNYANSLSKYGVSSFLISTRAQGEFVSNLDDNVGYCCLERRRTIDFRAILKLVNFLRSNNIEIVHAHGTSWFIATLCKFIYSDFKLIWHNHYGNSLNLSYFKKTFLSVFSIFFNGIISVNKELHCWSKNNLNCKNTILLPNYISPVTKYDNSFPGGFNIVYLANLRQEKNHKILLDAVDILKDRIKLKVHFIGRDFKDEYSKYIREQFALRRKYVILHDSISDPYPILCKMDLGVLVSEYEGMSMAVLEYGAACLPVVSTNVGSCREILGNRGIIIPPNDLGQLVTAIETYAIDIEKAKSDSIKLHNFIMSNFASTIIIPKYLEFCKSLC